MHAPTSKRFFCAADLQSMRGENAAVDLGRAVEAHAIAEGFDERLHDTIECFIERGRVAHRRARARARRAARLDFAARGNIAY